MGIPVGGQWQALDKQELIHCAAIKSGIWMPAGGRQVTGARGIATLPSRRALAAIRRLRNSELPGVCASRFAGAGVRPSKLLDHWKASTGSAGVGDRETPSAG